MEAKKSQENSQPIVVQYLKIVVFICINLSKYKCMQTL